MINFIDTGNFLHLLNASKDKTQFIKNYLDDYMRKTFLKIFDEESIADFLMELYVLKKELQFCLKSKNYQCISTYLQEFNSKIQDINQKKYVV